MATGNHDVTLGQHTDQPTSSSSDDQPPQKKQATVNPDGTLGQYSNPPSPTPSDVPETPYSITKKSDRVYANNGVRDVGYQVIFNDQWRGKRLQDIPVNIQAMLQDVLDRVKGGEDHLGRVIFKHASLDTDIVVPLQPWHQLNAQTVWQAIEKVLNSQEELAIDDSFTMTVGDIEIPQGNGLPRKYITQLQGSDNSISKKRSLIEIVNNDHLCMARAVTVCWARLVKIDSTSWQKMKGSSRSTTTELILKYKRVPEWYLKKVMSKPGGKRARTEQLKLTEAICQAAGVSTHRPGNINDLHLLETFLDVQILVIGARAGNNFIRLGQKGDTRPKLFLYLVDNEEKPHFHGIASLTGFFCTSYFCHTCLKPYSNKKHHDCSTTCRICLSSRCTETDQSQSCRECHMICRGPECFERHKLRPQKSAKKKSEDKLPSQCEKYWQCTTCKKTVNTFQRPIDRHKCGEWNCQSCECWVVGEHKCHIRIKGNKPKEPKLIFYDFETRQDDRNQCKAGYLPRPSCDKCTVEKQCQACMKCQNCNDSACGKMYHIPNFVVAQTACTNCIDEPVTRQSMCQLCGSRCSKCNAIEEDEFACDPCANTCGFREVVFQGENTLQDFGKWLFSPQHKGSTCIAHNARAFDNYPLIQYLVSQSIHPDHIIYQGSKVMSFTVGRGLNMTMLDSLNFLPMKLAALGNAFGLTEAKKGYFPFNFNTEVNQNYVGPYPDPHYYGADYMSTKDRTAFLEWHTKQAGAVFNFREEMEAYCRSDVDILRRACLKFRELMLQAADIDPFQSVTIASLAMKIFRTRFLWEEWSVKVKDNEGSVSDWITARVQNETWSTLRENKWVNINDQGLTIQDKRFVSSPIAQVPSEGYTKRDTYSKASIQWLEWLSQRKGVKIDHALNGGEFRVPGTRYRADGHYIDPTTGNHVILDYHGCIFHGCKTCYPNDRHLIKHPRTSQSLDVLFALTMKKKSVLEAMGYKYQYIWEHTFQKQLRTDSTLADFVKTLDCEDRLDPRDSFFGGRTNAMKLHYKVKEGEKIRYVDYTSLYPFCNKYGRYPVGHPEIITDNFKPVDQYFGIIKATVVPPRGLYHPVLPYKSKGKLKFPLCRTCADSESTSKCVCLDDQRALTGTWCSLELQLALEKGYRVARIFEVYHWPESTQYDKESGQGGLFAEYINVFLKYKQEASGWPEWVQTEQDKVRYINSYKQHEGIDLDPQNVVKNPGLRYLAKLSLNSMWGKWAEALNHRQTSFIHDSEAHKFFQLISDPTKTLYNFHIIADDIIQLEWEHKPAFMPEDTKTNIFVAIFTTAIARTTLYSLLDFLNERVLYMDTDSCIYVSRPGDPEPEVGDYLGQLCDELNGDWIIEFISGGPKNYSYRTFTGKEVCKVRGFSLNFTNSQLINFSAIRDMVVGPYRTTGYICVTNNKINRNKRTHTLWNKTENKKYSITYTKRVIVPDTLDTVPYGY